jgi:hypothetical protein
MTTSAPDLDPKKTGSSRLLKLVFIWGPILIGVFHQILMAIFKWNRIWVILDPPKYIYPFVTLEVGWWLVLTLLTTIPCLFALANRLRPRRMIYPFYAYLVYLLIFVKPV